MSARDCPEALAAGLLRILSDEELRMRLTRNAIDWAKQFSRERAANEFMNVISARR